MKILCILLLATGTAWGAVGTITDQVNAPPHIERKKQDIVAAKGAGVEMQDTIRTGLGKVGIRFEDDTKVQITENSKLVIDDFVYDPKNAKGGKLAMNVALGTVRYASGQIAKNAPQSVNLSTPSATIAVRGTDFTATVDELGQSTVVLLPSCPAGWRDVERDCKTGAIEVITDVGKVLLDRPFQATKVESRSAIPLKPVVLNLSEDAIGNMLIVAPPKQLQRDQGQDRTRVSASGALDVDFLKETGLVNALEAEEKQFFQDKLSQNLLNTNLLPNILDMINAQMAAELNLLNTAQGGLLPDWRATSGVTVTLDEPTVTLCRDDGSNVQCVSTRTTQNTTILQQQGSIEIKNRVNAGGSTTITLIQR